MYLMGYEVPTHNAILRLGGHQDPIALHEIPMLGITLKEITLLRKMHGPDAVTKVEEVGKRSFAEPDHEMFYLARKYSANATDMQEQALGVQLVARTFQQDMSGYDAWMQNEIELEEQAREEREEAQRKAANEILMASKAGELAALQKQARAAR